MPFLAARQAGWNGVAIALEPMALGPLFLPFQSEGNRIIAEGMSEAADRSLRVSPLPPSPAHALPSMIGGVAMTMIASRSHFDRAGRPLQRSCQSDMQNGERGRQEGEALGRKMRAREGTE